MTLLEGAAHLVSRPHWLSSVTPPGMYILRLFTANEYFIGAYTPKMSSARGIIL